MLGGRRQILGIAIVITTATLLSPQVRGDIYTWQWVNPNDHSLGKKQSTTLVSGGAGVDAGPSASLTYLNLSTGYFIGANLEAAKLWGSNLTNADFSNANLKDAQIFSTTLTGATFDNAVVRGGNFESVTGSGFVKEQLYSTASYQAHDLTGIKLASNNLTNWNFAGQNLTNASFFNVFNGGATITGVNFTGAVVRAVNFNRATGFTKEQLYSTASYQNHDLAGVGLSAISLANWNLSSQNLTQADFGGATLTGTEFTNANLRGARFNSAIGFTKEQLYSASNYADGDLSSMQLSSLNLSGANFANQNLSKTSLNSSTLTGANFAGAIIQNAGLSATTARGFTKEQLYSTASYQMRDLTGVSFTNNNVAGWNFADQNLTNASFGGSDTVTGAIFTNAIIRDANLNSSSFTKQQLYSTASYINQDLTGLNMSYSDRSTWNFAQQKLTAAGFQETVLNSTDFTDADLTAAVLIDAQLNSAKLVRANLTNANVYSAILSGADLTNAVVEGADLGYTDITLPQIYSTASYKNKNLRGVSLRSLILTGGNFAGQNLANADFGLTTSENCTFAAADLTGVDFYTSSLSGANFTNASIAQANFSLSKLVKEQLYSTASYQNHDLHGLWLARLNLANWDFSGQNLSSANFERASFTGANLTNATIRGANLEAVAGLLSTQIYSTASYQQRDLSGISWRSLNFTNWNLSGQNLTNGNFANAIMAGNFSAADMRGAISPNYKGATAANLIRHDGQVLGLNLQAGQTLTVRDYDGDPSRTPALAPIEVRVDQQFAMAPTATMQMVFEADPWNSKISFAPSIPVSLGGGVLELNYEPGTNLAGELGRTLQLFDWTGVSRSGSFSVASPYSWDLSKLYTTGEVTLLDVPGLLTPGDFDRDGLVQPKDLPILLRALTNLADFKSAQGMSDRALTLLGDLNGSGTFDNGDIQPFLDLLAGSETVAVPEPNSLVLGLFALALCAGFKNARVRRASLLY
jgi:uncharacterized protein YjbI with pentapeptide repeats